MNRKIKTLIIKMWKFVYKIPLVNSIRLKGTKLEAENTFYFAAVLTAMAKITEYIFGTVYCEGAFFISRAITITL